MSREKRTQLRRRFELWNWIEFLERRGEGVGKAPSGGRRKLLILRIEVEIMHPTRQMFRRFKFRFYEGSINDELRRFIGKQAFLPHFDCRRIGSKFRCIRSTPTEIASMRLNFFVCFARTGLKSP